MTESSLRSVCVYCGSQAGTDAAYIAAGRVLGNAIAMAGLRLVYGGGTRGVMGALAESVVAGGGKVTGIIPEFLIDREATRNELGHLDELVVTDDMHARKHAMFERSDAFVSLPGGIGTLEEIVEIMTWAQLGRHTKPMLFANVNGFWNPMLTLLEHMAEAGFIHTAHLVKPIVVDEAEAIVPALFAAPHSADDEGSDATIRRL
ncbi:LOG family protein [Pararhizobium mangrovi]|uniref:Cytokinin riboside 5'-monophosphate phosphoribohydrolase n=1 Tax=Pararhizobium mangrovi TaxID=2590452 RepID=A0A506UDJ9_9HYPH|nr:TIGR00730 family Rossman fold protein [Pararhizobium mangrovi]TPW32020.1 TIGR00730 family Rossman fold protein [Pararhizobium mangrovi]